ncbi:MAG: MurR/RpiR family transcriptional regulator [Deltaproteobacteria bacterium]|nr:MurR/RpiR family transcriptional regulator [Deltaproteobacteria bacterium]
MVRNVTATSLALLKTCTPACLTDLRALLPLLSEHHARVAQFAMQNPAGFLDLDARELGYQCGTSEATIVRFCQRVGYRGLSEMKKILSLQLAANLVPARSATKSDADETVLERVFADCIAALRDTVASVDHASLERVAAAIARSELLYLFGAGGSAQVAQEAALKFLTLGFRTLAFVDPIQQLAAAKLVSAKDVAIAVTYAGNQKEVAEALRSAKERKAFCVGITSFEQSMIAKSTDALLIISPPTELLRGQTGAHRVAQVALLDALAVSAAESRAGKAVPKHQRAKRSRAFRVYRAASLRGTSVSGIPAVRK